MSTDSWGCGDSLKMIFLTKGISAVMVIQYSTSARRIEDFFSVLLICIGNVSLYKSHEVCVCLFWLFLSLSFHMWRSVIFVSPGACLKRIRLCFLTVCCGLSWWQWAQMRYPDAEVCVWKWGQQTNTTAKRKGKTAKNKKDSTVKCHAMPHWGKEHQTRVPLVLHYKYKASFSVVGQQLMVR